MDENFIVEFPLKVEKWQSDKIDKRLELLRQIYNYTQTTLLNKFKIIEESDEWKTLKTKKDKNDFLSTHPVLIKGFIKPVIFQKMKSKEIKDDLYGICEFVEKIVKRYIGGGKSYKDFGLNTTNVNAVAQHIWSAWEKKLFQKKKIKDKETGEFKYIPYDIHLRKYCELNTISHRKKSDNFNGLDVDLNNFILHVNINGRVGKNAKIITLPIEKRKMTEYEMYALKGGRESIRVITIVRKMIRGKYKYYVQFTICSEKPQKGRTLGKGKVGIDVGTQTIAVSSSNSVEINVLAEKCENVEKKISAINQKIDSSKRITNPQNYEEDGTYKKTEGGKSLKWNYSKRCKKLLKEKRELSRKQAAIRKICHNIDANKLLHFGDTFIVENNPISGWARKLKGIRQDKNGKILSNKRYGKSISNRAPAEFITILENKVKSLGGEFKKVDTHNAATQFDFTNQEFTKHKVNEKKIVLSNGNEHQRDMLAAFNLQHLKYNNENLKEYNVEEMINDYPNFYKLEKKEKDKWLKKPKELREIIGL